MTTSPRQRSRPTVIGVAIGLIAASLIATAGAWAADVGASAGTSAKGRVSAAPTPEAFTGLIATPLASPHPVTTADGTRHLTYELQLTNATQATVTVERVVTVDPANSRVLSTLDADAVSTFMVRFATGQSGATLSPGGAGYILMDVALGKGARVPSRLAHDFTVAFDPDQGLPTEERSGVTPVTRDRPVVIGGPLTGANWLVLNGCCGFGPHRLAVNPINGAFHVAERFAIDFVQLDADGRGFTGDPTELSSFPSYGEPVVSVARGVVVDTLDGVVDNTPVGVLPPIELETIGGNYVVVDIGDGRFAYYAHLQPGSLEVQVGEHVRRGQLLGLVGNSGNSDFPHLHFHVMDTPSPLASDGLPYEFRFFESEGTLENLDEVFSGGTARFNETVSGQHSRQLPLDLQSVTFPSRHGGHGRH